MDVYLCENTKKSTELYTLNKWLLCCVNCILIISYLKIERDFLQDTGDRDVSQAVAVQKLISEAVLLSEELPTAFLFSRWLPGSSACVFPGSLRAVALDFLLILLYISAIRYDNLIFLWGRQMTDSLGKLLWVK